MAHSPVRVILIVVAFVVYLVQIVCTYLAYNRRVPALFLNETDILRDAYYYEVAPMTWTFYVWFPVWLWQFLWLLYALTTICRAPAKTGSTYLYTHPVMHPVIFLSMIVNNILLVTSLFLWDRGFIDWATLALGLSPLILSVGLAVSIWKLHRHLEELMGIGWTYDVWFIRFLMQNGMAVLISLGFIETCWHVAIVMTYRWGVVQDVSSSVVLGIISFVFIVWFLLESIALDKFTRYIFSPYTVPVVCIIAAVLRNYDLKQSFRNSVFLVCVEAAAVAMLSIRTLSMICCHWKRPIGKKKSYDVECDDKDPESHNTDTGIESTEL